MMPRSDASVCCHARSRARRAVAVAVALGLAWAPPAPLQAVTLDTENNIQYEEITEADASLDMGLRFGGTVNKTLKFERSAGQFSFNDDVRVTGNIVTTGVISGAMLSIGGVAPTSGVLKTTSGAILNADLDTNDTLLVFGNVLGAHTLKFINSVQEFEFSKGVRVLGQISGSGNLAIEGAATVDDTTFFVDATGNHVGVRTKNPGNPLEVAGTASGLNLYATNSVTGSNIYAASQFSGAGLVSCSTSDSSKLLWNSTTKQFSCGTDQTGGGATGLVDHYVRASGDTMTGGLVIENRASGGGTPATITAGVLLEVAGTASGLDIMAQRALRSSGSLVVDGNAIFEGALTFGDALGDAVTVNAATWTFANDTNFALSGGANGLSFDTNTLSIDAAADRVGIGNTTPKAKLEVTGTSSGTNLYAANSVTGAHLYAATTLGGAGLSDCDTGGSSKLLWSADTKTFSCGTDQGGAGGSPGGSDTHVQYNDATAFGGEAAFTWNETLNQLDVRGTSSGADVFASRSLRSSGSIVLRPGGAVKPTLFANGTQKVGIMNGSPHSTLTSSGSFATATTIMTATGTLNGVHQVVFASGSSPITLTLPTAVGINGRQYTIKKIDTTLNNFVTIAPQAGQTIDGLASWILYNRGQEVTLASNGSNWLVADESKYSLYGYNARGTTLNQWYGSPSNGLALTTAVLTSTATIRAFPFIAEKVITINAMSISVQTTGVSAEVRLGLFRDNGNGYPGKLVVDAGTVVTTSTGQRSICANGCTAASTTLPVTIQPGLYWLAINNNAVAHTLRGYAIGGLNPITGFPVNYTTARQVGWSIANAYAAFPATFPPSAAAVTAAPLPAITVRILQ